MLAQHNPSRTNVIVGVRPEHLEDAALIDTYARIRALTFEVTVDFVESLGADKYVHFTTEGAAAHAAQLDELAAESGVGRKPVRGKGFHRVEGDHRADRSSWRSTPPNWRSSTPTPGSTCPSRPPSDATSWTEVRARLWRALRPVGDRPEPDSASVTFLGTEPIDVLRFGPDADGVLHYVSLGLFAPPDGRSDRDRRRSGCAARAPKSWLHCVGPTPIGAGAQSSRSWPRRPPSRVWCWSPMP